MATWAKCKVCGQRFDRDTEEYLKVAAARYAHLKCANLAGLSEFIEDPKEVHQKEMIENIHNKMRELLGEEYRKNKITRQIKKLLEDGRTVDGIYNTLIYWYDIKKNNTSKANGGIGIVDYIYEEAEKYFLTKQSRETKNQNIEINKTVEHIYVKPTFKKKPKKMIWFDMD